MMIPMISNDDSNVSDDDPHKLGAPPRFFTRLARDLLLHESLSSSSIIIIIIIISIIIILFFIIIVNISIIIVVRYFHQHIWNEVNLQSISLFASKLFVGPLQTRWRHLEEQNTKYQILNTEYRIPAPKHQTHACPKNLFCCRFIGVQTHCKQARDTLTTDSAESQFGKKDKADHLSLFMRPGSSFHVMFVGLYVIITIT